LNGYHPEYQKANHKLNINKQHVNPDISHICTLNVT